MQFSRLVLAGAAMLAVGAAAHAAPVYVKAGSLIDPGKGTVTKDAALVVDGGKIIAAGTQRATKVPKGATVIDLGSETVMPGFIDMHTHLTGDAETGAYESLGLSDERMAITGVKNARLTLLSGFTTVRDVGAESYSDVALRDAINEGDVPGPRLYVSGPPVGITGGHCSDINLLPPEYHLQGEGVANGPWEMRAKVRQNIKYGVDLIKTCSTGGVFSNGTSLGAAQGTLEELTAIVEEAHARGLKVAKEKGAYLSMDIYNTEYTLAEGEKNGVLPESIEKEKSISKIQRASFTAANKAGAKMVFGSDSGVYPHGDNPKQFSRMVQFGMTPMQAITAATATAAEALGKPDLLGCLDVGCAADMVAVSGDPLKDISILEKVGFIMKDGHVYKQDGIEAVGIR